MMRFAIFILVALSLPVNAWAALTSENYRVENQAAGAATQSMTATSSSYSNHLEAGGLYQISTSSPDAAEGGSAGGGNQTGSSTEPAQASPIPEDSPFTTVLNQTDDLTICHSQDGREYAAILNVQLFITLSRNDAEELRGHAGHPLDIVPPFAYDFGGGVAVYEGQNWNDTAALLYDDHCSRFVSSELPPATYPAVVPDDEPADATTEDLDLDESSASASSSPVDQSAAVINAAQPLAPTSSALSPSARPTGGLVTQTAQQITELADAVAVFVDKHPSVLTVTESAGIMALGTLSAFSASQVPFSLSHMGFVARHGFTDLFALIVFWRRRRPWGTVYDSVSKAPVDPAYVELFNSAGEKIDEAITDLDGRYAFVMRPGEYHLTVRKTNYIFPSVNLAGKVRDTVYQNLYFGEDITTAKGVAHDIPLDPMTFDWNQYEKLRTGQTKFIHYLDPWLARLGDVFFFAGAVSLLWQFYTTPSGLTFLLLAVYAVLLGLRLYAGAPVVYGRLRYAGRPLPLALIRVLRDGREFKRKTADEYGRYAILVPPGNYQIEINELLPNQSYRVLGWADVDGRKGIINDNFSW